jgi:hypothetical protein
MEAIDQGGQGKYCRALVVSLAMSGRFRRNRVVWKGVVIFFGGAEGELSNLAFVSTYKRQERPVHT